MKEHLSRFFGIAEKGEGEEIKYIPIKNIVPNRYQPRTVFDEEKIDELCQTIKTHGIIQPIVVRKYAEDQYEIIAGERRWRACTKLGMETIPAIVKDFNDTQAASVALIENLQREGLTPIEEALAYQKLIELHGLTQESLAQRLGKGQSTIANKLRLLHLPEECHQALRERKISERHARALLTLKDPELQKKFLKEIIDKQLNVKQTEELIEKHLNKKPPKKKKPLRKAYSRDMRLAMNTIRQSVDMVLKSGLSIETDEKEHEDYIEFTIRIPKQ
ncbi:parB-like partition protein [Caldalkalibacillus thermarum TA2.A1]|uniref:ParB-like partition protein n=1 Tax=Caldalkalibacillus thermarum (strain TA2.A1) TaxID=986075 RepID=F5L4S9_CALTT|nr:nucleoid occlusion protein [Caldalkalibacillus thermarum]EGL83646.1 parB-like partition protein [Caldalkalibacillus thermarum TA2.A1]